MSWRFNPFTSELDYYQSASVGSGDVVGPSSATDNAVARFDSTTGKLIQNSLIIVDDSGNIILPANVSIPTHNSTLGNTNAYTKFRTDNGGMIEQRGAYYDVYTSYFRVQSAVLEANGGGYIQNGNGWWLFSLAADAGNTLRNAGDLQLTDRYWNGSASTDQDFAFRHVLIDTAPTSRLALRFGGSEKVSIYSSGAATFTGAVTVPDAAYNATTWNGSSEVPTKNAVRDKFESLSSGGPSLGLVLMQAKMNVLNY